jgi:3-oxoacyl-[acyl-carrier protein] reductase
MTGALQDKVLVVTGGTRGIGRAIVLEAVRQGARVAFCGRETGAAGAEVEAAAAAIAGDGRTLAVRADISREPDVDALFEGALARFGRLDAVVNNAATSTSSLLVTHSTPEWDRVTATNVMGPFLVARRMVRTLRTTGRPGAIVSIGSVAANGARANASYSATKGVLFGLTRGLAAEYGPEGLRANLVVAGWVETDLASELPERTRRLWREVCPAQRPATPAEVAGVAVFLASDRSRHLNGQAIYATAGVRQLPV